MPSITSTLLTLGLLSLSTLLAEAAPQVYVPPPGLYCCPGTGPNGWSLLERQIGPFYIYCIYGDESSSVGCYFNPATGTGSTIPGCPSQAITNPNPPSCPV